MCRTPLRRPRPSRPSSLAAQAAPDRQVSSKRLWKARHGCKGESGTQCVWDVCRVIWTLWLQQQQWLQAVVWGQGSASSRRRLPSGLQATLHPRTGLQLGGQALGGRYHSHSVCAYFHLLFFDKNDSRTHKLK
jgi:hypothetical protein